MAKQVRTQVKLDRAFASETQVSNLSNSYPREMVISLEHRENAQGFASRGSVPPVLDCVCGAV
jgi:hypothetical protein